MSKVVSSASMSLDGFVAGPNDEVGPLFDWYEAGDVPWTSAAGDLTFRLSQRDADYWRGWVVSARSARRRPSPLRHH